MPSRQASSFGCQLYVGMQLLSVLSLTALRTPDMNVSPRQHSISCQASLDSHWLAIKALSASNIRGSTVW